MRNSKIAIATMVFVAAGAFAQNVAVGAGAGDDSCGNWLSARRTNNKSEEAFYLSWIQGYLSGKNEGAMPNDSVGLPNHKTIAAYMDKECAKSPLLPIFLHASGLFFNIQRQQARSPPRKP